MNKRGFTLIEMMAVVLIVGILATVALPQYQRALLKSRYVALMPGANALRDGEDAYFLMNRRYTSNQQELDVKVRDAAIRVRANRWCATVISKPVNSNVNARLVAYMDHSLKNPGATHCEAHVNDEKANWLCQHGLNGRLLPQGSTPSYRAYELEAGRESTNSGLCADINGDGHLDVVDVTYGINAILGKETGELADYDINDDGCVDTNDITCAIDIILGFDISESEACLHVSTPETCEGRVVP